LKFTFFCVKVLNGLFRKQEVELRRESAKIYKKIVFKAYKRKV